MHAIMNDKVTKNFIPNPKQLVPLKIKANKKRYLNKSKYKKKTKTKNPKKTPKTKKTNKSRHTKRKTDEYTI